MEQANEQQNGQQRLVLVQLESQILSALFSGQELLELNLEQIEEQSKLGNIYVGKVQNIVKNINAAFIQIAEGQMCYLPLEKNNNPVLKNGIKRENGRLLQGDELLVQICKEDVKTKAPVVTTDLSLTGKYLVLTRGKAMIGISSKIEDPEVRQSLKTLIEPYISEDYGFIVRTNARGASKEQLLREAGVLAERYRKLLKDGMYRNRFSKLYQTLPAYLCAVRDGISENLSEIITDNPMIYEQVHAYLSDSQPEDLPKLRRMDSEISAERLYGLRRKLNEALKERVWLKSGGYLVIQPTEALTVIDVNTGKAVTKKKDVQETFFRLNLEAAKEIAKQLRLRNLSGIILIDFINMEVEEHKEELLYALKEFVRNDPVKTAVVDMTALNLVELTRKKVRRPLHEQVNRQSEV